MDEEIYFSYSEALTEALKCSKSYLKIRILLDSIYTRFVNKLTRTDVLSVGCRS